MFYFTLEVSWAPRDFPVFGPLPDLYNNSKLCAICSASYRHLVKEERSLVDINEESINKAVENVTLGAKA